MKKIAASILGVENKVAKINELIENGIEWIHYDVMDGDFVNNTSLTTDQVRELIENTKDHSKDVHLMVQRPSSYIDSLIDITDQFSIHYESEYETTLEETINKYYNKTKLGLVVNPSTDIKKTFKHLNKLNHLMIMSVIPGKGGQTFIEESINKINLLVKEIKNKELDLIIEIDGGINDKWGPIAFENGVNLVVSGSYLINNLHNDAINKLK